MQRSDEMSEPTKKSPFGGECRMGIYPKCEENGVFENDGHKEQTQDLNLRIYRHLRTNRIGVMFGE